MRAIALGLAALGLAACSISMPIGSFASAGHSDDETGTISNDRLAQYLNGEDWQSAKAALVAALDPQGSGTAVHWTNPDSGAKGFFVADGKVYPSEAGICRAFVADIDRDHTADFVHGTACADKGGDWTVTAAAKQAKKS